MPGLSRFARKQPSAAAGTGAAPPAPPAAAGNNGDGGDAGAQSAVPPTNAAGNSGNNDATAVTNFSSSLDDNRPSTSGSNNAFADIGNMFANMDDQAMTMGGGEGGANSNMLDSTTFLSSTPTEGGGGDCVPIKTLFDQQLVEENLTGQNIGGYGATGALDLWNGNPLHVGDLDGEVVGMSGGKCTLLSGVEEFICTGKIKLSDKDSITFTG